VLAALPYSLRSRLDFMRATKDEVAQPIDMLPSRMVERALAGHEEEYARLIEAKVCQAIDVQPAETVWVPKAAHVGRYRPITALGLGDRVLLRALANELSADIPPFDRSFQAQEAFQRRPLETGASYVVIADVSAFYFFVDHELLASRLVDLTARADTAEVTRAVLDALMGRPYGLPQNFGPSMPLSEAFIGPVERRLLREGIVTFRANDDFRLCAHDWGGALQALERLQEEVSHVGLDLNSEKSWILKLETYASNLGLTNKLLAEALTSTDPDLPEINAYTGEPVESDENEEADGEDDEWFEDDEDEKRADIEDEDHDLEDDTDAGLAAAALRLFEHTAAQRLSDQQMSGFKRAANRQAMLIALQLLTRTRSEAGVDVGAKMVALDPLLTRPYVAYLRALPAEGQTTAERVQDTLTLFRGHAPFWAQAWLTNALLDPHVALTDSVRAWLQTLLVSRAPAVLRMRAALALAFHRELSAKVIGEMLDKLPAAARPDAAVAMALAGGTGVSSPAENAFLDDRLLRWVCDLASEHREDPGTLL
jgi:hypothetical protein